MKPPVPSFKLTQTFLNYDPINYKKTSHHTGCDYGTAGATNIPMVAIADGEIIESFSQTSPMGKYLGNHFYLYLGGERVTFLYCHASTPPPPLGKVVEGQQLGLVGQTGQSQGIHLHLEGYYGRKTSKDRVFATREDIIRLCFNADSFIRSKI